MLRDMDEKGGIRELKDIDYRAQFNRKWDEFTPVEQQTIDDEIEHLLDALRNSPDPLWGSIMNTSIEGGKANPFNGLRGDWTGTPWEPIWERHGRSDTKPPSFSATFGSCALSSGPMRCGSAFEAPMNGPRFPIAASTFPARPTS